MKSKIKYLSFLLMIIIVGIGFFPTNLIFAETPTQIKILTDNCYVYKSANTNLKINDTDATNTNIVGEAVFNQIYEVVAISGNFYEIKFTTTQNGFVLISFCCDANSKPIALKLDTNAVVLQTSFLYVKDGDNFVKQSSQIEANTRVKFLKTDGSFSQITINQDNENKTYYMLSDNLNVDGINSKTLTAILLIFTCSIIFLIIYSFYKRTQKQSKKN